MAMDSIAQLRQLLGQEKLKRRLNNVRAEVIESLKGQGGPEARQLTSKELHPEESRLVRAAMRGRLMQGDSPLISDVLMVVDRPAVVTLEDLIRAAVDHLSVWDEEMDAAFVRFGRSLLSRLKLVPSRPVAVAVCDTLRDAGKQKSVLWKNEITTIALCGSGPAGAEPGHEPTDELDQRVVLYARVNMFGSSRAVASVHDEAMSLLRSILVTSSLWHVNARPYETGGGLPDVWEDDLWVDLPAICKCLEVYFAKVKKGDSIESRLRNAMLLLTEADRQTHFAIAVSLCFSAMEAMLGKGNTDISVSLSRNIAALLEPPNAKRTAAMKVVKDLYNVRSKVLHGASLDHDPKTRQRCRWLASAVFGAVLERYRFMEKRDGETPDEFFNVLENAQMNGQQVEGVSSSMACELWS
jgi:hypothetical protein